MAWSYYRLMNDAEYRPALDVIDLMGELKRLLVSQRQEDRLICLYLADLADGMASYSALLLAYGDVYTFVRARLGLSFRAIRERIRVGRALRGLPLLNAALMSGELAYSRIREVTRVAEPETERIWLEVARRLSMRALEARVAAASGRPRSQSHGGDPQADTDFANPMLNLPAEVLALLKHAMELARAESGGELTDAEALTAVARVAIAHLAGSSLGDAGDAGDARATRTTGEWDGLDPTHRGSADDGTPEPDATAGTDVMSGDAVGRGDIGDDSESTNSRAPSSQATSSGATSRGATTSGATHSGSQLRRADWEAGTTGAKDGLRSTQDGSTAKGSRHEEPLSMDEQLLLELVRSGGYWNAATLQHTTGIPRSRLVTALFNLEVRHLIALGPLGVLEPCGKDFSRAG